MQESDLFLTNSQFVETNTGKITSHYDFVKEIGKGGYGTVYLAHPKNKPEKKRAIKQIRKKPTLQPASFFNEINILMKMDHPNIIKIYETFEDSKSYYVVTDYCEGGELFDRLSEEGSFSERDARQIFKQILYAIKYCHSQNVAHRDLKPENFLFLEKKSLSLKIIDFGLSYAWKEDMRNQLLARKEKKLIGTSYYIAPEILKANYDEKCDIWSLGVILYILVSAAPPFDGDDDREIMKAVSTGKYSLDIPEMKGVSDSLKDLISKILVPEETRITIDGIYDHPWMKEEIQKKPLKLNFRKMVNYTKYSKLKKFAVAYIVSQIPSKDIEKLGDIFKQIDADHDGFITSKELETALEKQKDYMSLGEVENLIKYIDTDHNGKINYSQFVACCLENAIIFKQEHLISVFQMLDADKNGKISPEELRNALKKSNPMMKEGVINQIIGTCDLNGDGNIDFKEFLNSISQI